MSSISNRRHVTRLLLSIGILTLLTPALGPAVHAQADGLTPPFVHFHGLLNDYTPSNVTGGPYEMRGVWALDIHGHTADFKATFNMETSDYGVNTGVVDPTMPPTRGAHTHTILLTGASLSTDTSHCPSYSPATTGPVIVVTGQPQIITGNGGPAPFQLKGPTTLWICLAGGTEIPLSNFAMTFADGPATGHFGSYAIHGVILPEKH
jgi:hypothetical protein